MAEAGIQGSEPPKLRVAADGVVDTSSLADALEWFLGFDERTARMRHRNTDELFAWKQADDQANGIAAFPFENAEARFALGAIQAVRENDSEPLLKLWITDVLEALGGARETRTDLEHSFNLTEGPELSSLKKAAKLTTNTERRLYLTSCWIEVLCTAEVRFLGWVYQELYGKPFSP